MYENVCVFKNALHIFSIGDKVGREIAFVELHAFDNVEGGFDCLGFFNRYCAVFADLVHGFGNDVANFLVPVGGHGGNLPDFLAVLYSLGILGKLFNSRVDSFVDAALYKYRVAQAFAVDGLRQNSRSCSAVAGVVGSLVGDFLDHLGAHIFKGVFKLDFFRNAYAVLCYQGSAVFFVDYDIAAFRAESRLDCFGKNRYARENLFTGCFVENNLFSHICFFYFLSVI